MENGLKVLFDVALCQPKNVTAGHPQSAVMLQQTLSFSYHDVDSAALQRKEPAKGKQAEKEKVRKTKIGDRLGSGGGGSRLA